MKTHPQSLLTAYLDNALLPDERQALLGHLQQCPVCRQELAAQHRVQTLLAALPPLVPPQSSPAFWRHVQNHLGKQDNSLGLGWLWGALMPLTAALTHGLLFMLTLLGISGLLGFSFVGWLGSLWRLPFRPPVLPEIVSIWYENSLLGQILTSSLAALFPVMLVILLTLAVFSLFLGILLSKQTQARSQTTS